MFDIMEEYLSMCPQLADMDSRCDYGGTDEGWTLHDNGTEVLYCYWDGSRMKKQSWSLQFRAFAADDKERSDNLKRMDKVLCWLQDCSERGILPELGDERLALRIDCESSGQCLMETDGISAIYNLNLALTYEERSASLAS